MSCGIARGGCGSRSGKCIINAERFTGYYKEPRDNASLKSGPVSQIVVAVMQNAAAGSGGGGDRKRVARKAELCRNFEEAV